MTQDQIQLAADTEELRLDRIVDDCIERIRDINARHPKNPDELHDFRIDIEGACARLDNAQQERHNFGLIPDDATLLKYLARTKGDRAGWLETELKKIAAAKRAERSRRDGAEAQELVTEGHARNKLVNPHGD